MTWLLVVLGGMAGAPLRYLTDRALRHRSPLGTLLVNVAGSMLLGFLTGAADALPEAARVLVGTGFCGALTTYSTFSAEVLRLVEEARYLRAALYVTASVLLAVTAAAAAYHLC